MQSNFYEEHWGDALSDIAAGMFFLKGKIYFSGDMEHTYNL
jgi:hypothetical protein